MANFIYLFRLGITGHKKRLHQLKCDFEYLSHILLKRLESLILWFYKTVMYNMFRCGLL